MIMIVLALFLFGLGALWHGWRLSASQSNDGSVRRAINVMVTAGLLVAATVVLLNERLGVNVGFWPALLIFGIFLMFADSAYSALRFHVEDRDTCNR